MIIKTYPNRNIYGKYFLATEAPDDEEVTEEQPKPRRNVKVISVKPSNRGKDFTQIENEQIDVDNVEYDEDIDNDTTDYGEEEPEAEQEVQADTEQEPAEVDADTANEQPQPEVDNNTEEQPVQNQQPAEQADEPVEQPDTGDNADYTDTGEDPNAQDYADNETGEEGPDTGDNADYTDTGEDPNAQQPVQDQVPDNGATKTAPGVEFDSTRKYNLYKEFMSLYNACDNYISKLENILRNDYEENQIIRISVINLREIKDIVSDYMTIRFPLSTYVQSLLFYQKMVVSIQLVFNLLKSIGINKTK